MSGRPKKKEAAIELHNTVGDSLVKHLLWIGESKRATDSIYLERERERERERQRERQREVSRQMIDSLETYERCINGTKLSLDNSERMRWHKIKSVGRLG